ncbi:hypothetical protein CDAR_168381 [Caerostris darwini]|uniref:Uncharacterized protein n=1 Tax=Caerostris darwini TaxID=1538125 RepID=A0AAV4TAI3_9ARAC|nr:hypothetical protein CDAR_168381 [Caerostris darwini]
MHIYEIRKNGMKTQLSVLEPYHPRNKTPPATSLPRSPTPSRWIQGLSNFCKLPPSSKRSKKNIRINIRVTANTQSDSIGKRRHRVPGPTIHHVPL